MSLLTEYSLERREFLRLTGFTFAAAALVGCSRAPVEKALPFLTKPEEITPGKSYYYASTCGACSAGCGLLVKNRDGRPIKLEGNPDHPLSRGGLCAVGQASILGLYDGLRLQQPLLQGQNATWDEVDRQIISMLEAIRQSGGAVRFLSNTNTSPTANWMINRFLSQFNDARYIVYDPLSSSAILDAHERTFGVRALPRYHFDKADVIVNFDADFLGTWISPVEYTAAYQAGRSLEGDPPRMSYHVQFESRLSVTGSKADQRFAVAPQEIGALLSDLAAQTAERLGVPFPRQSEASLDHTNVGAQHAAPLRELSDRLIQARGRSLIVSGSQDLRVQILCNYLNHILGNYGSTLDLERPSLQRQGHDQELEKLQQELEDGRVAALFIADANPVYDLPEGDKWAALIQKTPLVVNFAQRQDETAAISQFVCPDHYYLEAWRDSEAVSGIIGITQPAIQPLGRTRQIEESLAVWMETPRSAFDLLQESWAKNVYPKRRNDSDFQAFWDQALMSGFVEIESETQNPKSFNMAAVQPIAESQTHPAGSFGLVLYPKVGMLDGRHAYNPWLQELPDPISKVTWDNYACISPAAAAKLALQEGDVVRLSVGDDASNRLELPVYIQPGQHDEVVAVALGYGSRSSDRFAHIGPNWLEAQVSVGDNGLVGKNAAPLIAFGGGRLRYDGHPVKLEKTGAHRSLACTQTHHSVAAPKHLVPLGGEIRPIIRQASLQDFGRDPVAAFPLHAEKHQDLWPPDHPYPGHRWAMAIDLSACTGCSACVIACQVENNVPVVGRDEVERRREMHWIRIDRYFDESPEGLGVSFMPMMCQHCDNAPCESVCPVLATVHSEEGLSQQVYNRCVGTRYCANNCPYKVRRFNWFNYARDDQRQNLVLNPDVVVRSRGVMEKCSFCVQRIQETKIEAKRKGAKISDGKLQTACQQGCPAKAIVFGDMNDPDSKVAQLLKNPRYYRVLGELNTKPAVGYLGLIRNRETSESGRRHG